MVVVGAVLSVCGWHEAAPGKPNTFLNFDNLIDGIATPMSYYAIMAVGVTIVIIIGGIDISVGSIMALSALGRGRSIASILRKFFGSCRLAGRDFSASPVRQSDGLIPWRARTEGSRSGTFKVTSPGSPRLALGMTVVLPLLMLALVIVIALELTQKQYNPLPRAD